MANGKAKQNTGIEDCVGVNSVSPERAGLESVCRERGRARESEREAERERESAEHN